MNNPASAILDGLSVAGNHWRLVLGIVAILVICQGLLAFLFRKILGEQFFAEETISIGLAGWLLPASLFSLLWYMAAGITSIRSSIVIVALLLLAGLVLSILSYRSLARSFNIAAISLVVLAGLFLLLRLAFVAEAFFPMYFDSAQHYQFINEILVNLKISSAGNGSTAAFYHRGFHTLAAFLTSLTGAQITDSMLVLGQVILAMMPFSAFFIVRHWSGSNSAGFFALALAAFGWYMPAHAVDWGKYPALASIALIPFVLCIAYLSMQNRNVLPRNRYLGLVVLLLAGMLVSVLLHSRSLVIYGLLAIAWLVTTAWSKMGRKPRSFLLVLFLLVLAGEIIFIQTKGILAPLFDAYGMKSIWIGSSILLLSFFAYRVYPGLVSFCIVSTSLLLASLFVPLVNVVPGFALTTLLDRPYIQMLLYLPLTLLGGFGLAGLEKQFQDKRITWGRIQFTISRTIGILLIMLVAINAVFRYDLYPSDCCVIVSRDDLAAIHWMDENLPEEARILTSSTDLKVLPTEEYQGSAGGDAGTWITPLIGRPVAYMPFNTDFSQRQTLDLLCRQQVGYIYVGKTGSYFDDTGMRVQPDGYKRLLDLPKARVYQVIGCE